MENTVDQNNSSTPVIFGELPKVQVQKTPPKKSDNFNFNGNLTKEEEDQLNEFLEYIENHAENQTCKSFDDQFVPYVSKTLPPKVTVKLPIDCMSPFGSFIEIKQREEKVCKRDIELIVEQCKCTFEEAEQSFNKHDGDLVAAIMELTKLGD